MTSGNAPFRQGIFALFVACQEDTLRYPFKPMAQAFKLGATASQERLNTVQVTAAGGPMTQEHEATTHSLAAVVPGEVALSGRASWPSGDQS
jgi:hypothetical protein